MQSDDLMTGKLVAAIQHLGQCTGQQDSITKGSKLFKDVLYAAQLGRDTKLVTIERLRLTDQVDSRWEDQSDLAVRDYDRQVRGGTSGPERPLGRTEYDAYWQRLMVTGAKWPRVRPSAKKAKLVLLSCMLCQGPHKAASCPKLPALVALAKDA